MFLRTIRSISRDDSFCFRDMHTTVRALHKLWGSFPGGGFRFFRCKNALDQYQDDEKNDNNGKYADDAHAKFVEVK